MEEGKESGFAALQTNEPCWHCRPRGPRDVEEDEEEGEEGQGAGWGQLGESRVEKGSRGRVKEQGWRARKRRRVKEEEEEDWEEGSEAVAAGDRCLGGGGPRQT